jgi:hypothetical protein
VAPGAGAATPARLPATGMGSGHGVLLVRRFFSDFSWCKGNLCRESNQICDAKETCVVN